MSGTGGPEPHPVVELLQRVTPTPIRKRFTLKFGLALALMALSIGAIGFAATDMVSAQTEERVTTEFRNTTQQKAEIVREWRLSNSITARLLSESDAWTQGENRSAAAEAERDTLSDDVQQIHLINGTDSEPRVLASTSRIPSQPVTGVTRPYIQNASRLDGLGDDEVYVSDTYEVNDLPLVGFVSPVPDRPNTVLVVEMSLSSLRESLASQGERRAVVVDEGSHTVMAGEQSGDALSTYAESDEALRPVRAASALRANDTAAGVVTEMPANEEVLDEPYTVGYAPVGNSDWVVLVHSPTSAEFGFVQTISEYGVYATMLAVLLIGITGTVIGYSTSTAIDRLTRKTQRMREGDLDVEVSTTRIDNIGRLYEGFAEMRDSLKEQIAAAEQARKEAEVSRAEALEMSRHLEEKAEQYSETMQAVAAGDLTRRMTQDGENEAMDTIAAEFNEMVAELEKTTGQLKSYVDEVEEAGREVERSASTVRTASEEVADAVQTVAVEADERQQRLESLAREVAAVAEALEASAAGGDEDLAEQLGAIQDAAAELRELAERSEEMQTEADTISAAAEEQAAELTQVSERANDLQRYAEPLRDILDRFETEAEHEFVFSVGPTGAERPAERED